MSGRRRNARGVTAPSALAGIASLLALLGWAPAGAAAAEGTSPPPGVSAVEVNVRQPAPDAPTTLAQVLERIGPLSAVPPDGAARPEEGSAEERQFLKRYLRGREALAQGKALKAVTDLEQAAQAAPGDSAVLRALAHAYSMVGNEARSIDAYERLLAANPGDPEALLTTGMAAMGRRRYEDAVRRLGPVLAAGAAAPGGDGDGLTPTGRVLGGMALGLSLKELGLDAAAVEAWQRALAVQDEQVGDAADADRNRAELLRSIGDASLRLGRPAEAIAAYERAAALPGLEGGVVEPRILLALLRAERLPDAVDRLARRLSAEDHAPLAMDAELTEWLVSQPGAAEGLRAAARTLRGRLPQDPTAARIAAAADPASALQAWEGILKADPHSEDALRGFLASAAAGTDGARTLAGALVGRIKEAPTCGREAVAAALTTRVDETSLRAALAALPDSAARREVQARLAMNGRDLGKAWRLLADAREAFPTDAGLAWAQLDAAAAMEEPLLVRSLESGAPGTAAGLPPGVESAARVAAALRSAGDLDGAIERLERLVAGPEVPWRAETELAQSLVEAAAVDLDRARRTARLERAKTLALAALERHPSDAEAAAALIRIVEPRTGLAPDAEAMNTLRARMRNGALAWVDERLSVEEELARGRADLAMGRLMRLAERRPFDSAAVAPMVSTFVRFGRGPEALAWLDAAREQQPALHTLRDGALSAMALTGRGEEAKSQLEARLHADPEDALAAWHLETMLRGLGREDEAVTLSRERLLARPAGPRRSLELANLEERAGRMGEAMAALQDVASASWLTPAQRVAALEVASRLPDTVVGRSDFMRALAEAGLAAGDDQVLTYVAAASLAAAEDARGGSRAEREEALARVRDLGARAASTRLGADGGAAAAVRWRDAAQLLLDAREPAAAAELIRTRLAKAPNLEPAAFRLLVAAALSSDALAGGRATQAMELVRMLRDEGLRPFAWAQSGAEREAAALYELSNLFSLVGDKPGSEAILEEALKSDPAHAMAMNNLGFARLERGAMDETTVSLIEKAASLASEEASVLDTLGWLRYRQGRLSDGVIPRVPPAPGDPPATPSQRGQEGAVTLLARAVALDAESPSLEVLDHLGDALWKAGEHERAIKAWQQVVGLGEERFERTAMTRQIAAFLATEMGVRAGDPDRFYEEHYGAVIERARRKLAAVERGGTPAVAESAGT